MSVDFFRPYNTELQHDMKKIGLGLMEFFHRISEEGRLKCRQTSARSVAVSTEVQAVQNVEYESFRYTELIIITTIIIFIIIMIVIFIILHHVQNKPCKICTYVCLLHSDIIAELTCSGWSPEWSGMQQLDALFRLLLTLQAS